MESHAPGRSPGVGNGKRCDVSQTLVPIPHPGWGTRVPPHPFHGTTVGGEQIQDGPELVL